MKTNKDAPNLIDLEILTIDPLIAKLCYEYWMYNDDGKFSYHINHLEARYNLSPYKLRQLVKQHSIARSRELKCTHCNQHIILSSRSDFKTPTNRAYQRISLLCEKCKGIQEQEISRKAAEESKQWEREVVQMRDEYVEEWLSVKWAYLDEKRQEDLFYEFQNVEHYGKLEIQRYLTRIQLGDPINEVSSKTGISARVFGYLKAKFSIKPGNTKTDDRERIEELEAANLRLQRKHEKLLSEHTDLKKAVKQIASGMY